MAGLLGNTIGAAQTFVGNIGNIIGGRTLLHAMQPDNFEYYLCSLELVDDPQDGGSSSQIAVLPFTVMPDNMVTSKTQIMSQNKTIRGLNLLHNSGFTPFDINLQGSFGRKLRFFWGKDVPERLRDRIVTTQDSLSGYENTSSNAAVGGNKFLIKTGYGQAKLLEKMIEMSWQTTSINKSLYLIFRNYAWNQHVYVEVLNHAYSQTIERNAIWNYSLNMRAIAPAVTAKTFADRYAEMMKISALTYAGKSLTKLNAAVADALSSDVLPPSINGLIPAVPALIF
jgi:hypothetical protein